MKLATMDLEIFDDLPEGAQYTHEGISDLAIAYKDDAGLLTCQEFFMDDHQRLDAATAMQAAEFMMDLTVKGYQLMTWNGLGFDFRVLAIEAGVDKHCFIHDLAITHIDPMFNIFCIKGYPIALQQACQGMHLAGKVHEVTLTTGEVLTEMHGSKAPGMWRAGEWEAVRTYLRGDVLSLLELAETVERMRYLRWMSKSGRPWAITPLDFFRTVAESLMLPAPDNNWMDKPIKREEFAGWLILPDAPVDHEDDDPDHGWQPEEDLEHFDDEEFEL